jgi:hypothetical protein
VVDVTEMVDVRVVDSPTHPELVGRDALIDGAGTRVLFDPSSG